MRIAVAARRDAERRQHRFDIGDALGGGGFADFGHQNDGRQNHLARAEIAANVGRHHRATGEEDGGEQKGDFFHRVFLGLGGESFESARERLRRGLYNATEKMRAAAKARTDSAHSLALRPPLSLSRALLFPFPAKAGIQIGSAEYGGIETLPAFAETGDSNWIPAFAGKGFDNIAGRTMTDSFSSASDSARNFFRRRWRWVVGALVLYFIFGNYLAMFLGYAETVTETVIENGKPVGKETTSWLSPGARLLRDSFIAIAAILGIVMAGWRNFALDRQSKAASEQAQNDSDRIAGERFSDAVKLLAQKDAEHKPALDARIGGIYSLQTLANNRIKEYGAQVVKTLISYIKQNAQLTTQLPLKENKTPKETRALGEDVKTAFNVLRQLLTAREKDSTEWNKPADGIKLSDRDLSFSGQDFSWLDLSASQVGGLHRYIWSWVNLQGAKLLRTQLQGADLSDAQLQSANLIGAHLQGTNLSNADLQGANLLLANLQGANLFLAQLQGAKLSGVELQGAKLFAANLQGAKLSRAHLQGAKLSLAQLQGAKLSNVELQYADLSKAKLNDATILPSPSNLSGKIWHSGQPELLEIVSLSPDAEWDLTPFLCSGYALAGVLRNFALQRRFLVTPDEEKAPAIKLRIAARKLLDENKLPKDDFPQDWRDWLGEIESDGSHPNDSRRSG